MASSRFSFLFRICPPFPSLYPHPPFACQPLRAPTYTNSHIHKVVWIHLYTGCKHSVCPSPPSRSSRLRSYPRSLPQPISLTSYHHSPSESSRFQQRIPKRAPSNPPPNALNKRRLQRLNVAHSISSDLEPSPSLEYCKGLAMSQTLDFKEDLRILSLGECLLA